MSSGEQQKEGAASASSADRSAAGAQPAAAPDSGSKRGWGKAPAAAQRIEQETSPLGDQSWPSLSEAKPEPSPGKESKLRDSTPGASADGGSGGDGRRRKDVSWVPAKDIQFTVVAGDTPAGDRSRSGDKPESSVPSGERTGGKRERQPGASGQGTNFTQRSGAGRGGYQKLQAAGPRHAKSPSGAGPQAGSTSAQSGGEDKPASEQRGVLDAAPAEAAVAAPGADAIGDAAKRLPVPVPTPAAPAGSAAGVVAGPPGAPATTSLQPAPQRKDPQWAPQGRGKGDASSRRTFDRGFVPNRMPPLQPVDPSAAMQQPQTPFNPYGPGPQYRGMQPGAPSCQSFASASSPETAGAVYGQQNFFVGQAYSPGPYMSPHTPPPQDMAFLRQAIVKQIEYYFSMDNLCRDIYLRNMMDETGWVHLGAIASFNRVRSLTTDVKLIAEALRDSPVVEVKDGRLRKRDSWQQFILPRARPAPPPAPRPRPPPESRAQPSLGAAAPSASSSLAPNAGLGAAGPGAAGPALETPVVPSSRQPGGPPSAAVKAAGSLGGATVEAAKPAAAPPARKPEEAGKPAEPPRAPEAAKPKEQPKEPSAPKKAAWGKEGPAPAPRDAKPAPPGPKEHEEKPAPAADKHAQPDKEKHAHAAPAAAPAVPTPHPAKEEKAHPSGPAPAAGPAPVAPAAGGKPFDYRSALAKSKGPAPAAPATQPPPAAAASAAPAAAPGGPAARKPEGPRPATAAPAAAPAAQATPASPPRPATVAASSGATGRPAVASPEKEKKEAGAAAGAAGAEEDEWVTATNKKKKKGPGGPKEPRRREGRRGDDEREEEEEAQSSQRPRGRGRGPGERGEEGEELEEEDVARIVLVTQRKDPSTVRPSGNGNQYYRVPGLPEEAAESINEGLVWFEALQAKGAVANGEAAAVNGASAHEERRGARGSNKDAFSGNRLCQRFYATLTNTAASSDASKPQRAHTVGDTVGWYLMNKAAAAAAAAAAAKADAPESEQGALPVGLAHRSRELLEKHSYTHVRYVRFRERALKEREKKGAGGSMDMNTLYFFWSHFLRTHFNRRIYDEFKTLALEDAGAGAKYGLDCLFRMMSYALDKRFRAEVFEDFQELALREYGAENSFGVEKLIGFLRSKKERAQQATRPELRDAMAKVAEQMAAHAPHPRHDKPPPAPKDRPERRERPAPDAPADSRRERERPEREPRADREEARAQVNHESVTEFPPLSATAKGK